MYIWSLGQENSPEERSGNPLQFSCLGNYKAREDWRATAHGVTKELGTTEQLNSNKHISFGCLEAYICVPFYHFLLSIKFKVKKKSSIIESQQVYCN